VTLGSTTPGNTLTVRGDYIGQDGKLRMLTTLGGSDSPTDRLIIDGGRVSGRTNVGITNVNGLGAATDGDGIEVIRAINGATTTAQTTRDAFFLHGEHVDAGAYEYRLYPGDTRGTGENWYLRSTLPASASGALDNTATGPGRVTYRPDVALYAALPATLAQADLAMLGNLHRREGGNVAATATSQDGSERRVWGRFIDQNMDIRQQGTVTPRGEGWTSGGQLGVDLFTNARHRVGIYGGTLEWKSHVHGDAGGIPDQSVGHLQGRTNYAGAYWTYTAESGWYSDLVLQHGRQRGKANSVSDNNGDIRARSTLASLEMGTPLQLNDQWYAEPQAQIIATHQDIDDVTIPAATVRQHSGNAVVARVGVRLKGDYSGAYGNVQPYARFNVWHGLSGTDTQSIKGPAGDATINTRRGYTSGEVAIGGTWTVNRRISLYGEIGRLFPLSSEQRVSAQHAISAGLRIVW
jgi:outer membrane autotransporter protein